MMNGKSEVELKEKAPKSGELQKLSVKYIK
jgi:hypothetical protein